MILANENEDLVECNLDFIIIFLLGASIGSFLSLVAIRLPEKFNIINLPSRCDQCANNLRFYELIPLFSYLALKGKCKTCHHKIDPSLFFTELLTAFLFMVIYLTYGFDLYVVKILVLFSILIVLSLIDWKYKAVPDTMLLVLVIVSLIPIEVDFFELSKNFLIFCGSFFLLDFIVTYYIQHIKYKITKNEDLLSQKALGEGDIPIAAVIGAILGIKLGMIAIFCAALFAVVPSIYYMVSKKEAELPFIPFLSLGLFIVFILKAYL